jgi:biotin carboxyl carrier protein
MATVTIGERSYEVEVHGETVVVDGHEFPIKRQAGQGFTTVTAGGVQYRVALPPESDRVSGMAFEVDHRPMTIAWEGSPGGGAARSQRRTLDAAAAGTTVPTSVKGGIAAQIAGRVVSVKVKVGDSVAAGDVVLLLEAMKMENEIKAPAGGMVTEVRVANGQRVAEGEVMVVVG